ncbi:MAG: ATP-binding cassette domain-containing protein, partial [Candidatus Thermoplasmatota archaeon]|nr:ATP-binding cassette domain-containing protein [Candidatus Thermoplasmatota archaeon]
MSGPPASTQSHPDGEPSPLPTPETKQSVIHAHGLSKWYGNVIGLNGFNVDITEGITGIVGPNGSGKSTLFKLIVGTIKSNAGNLLVNGKRPWGDTEQLKDIGFCPDYEFLPLD